MNNEYVSSIVTKYGDLDNVKKDGKALHEILSRQGVSLLIDVIAEHAGNTVVKYKLSDTERNKLVDSLVNEFKESLSERS